MCHDRRKRREVDRMKMQFGGVEVPPKTSKNKGQDIIFQAGLVLSKSPQAEVTKEE